MAKSHFARWHLTNKYKTFARGTLRELILIGEPSGNTGGNPRGTHPHPRGTLGEPIPGKPRGTVGVPKSQISIKIAKLISKTNENQCFLLRFAISLLDVISTLAFCTFVFRKRFIFAYKTPAKLH